MDADIRHEQGETRGAFFVEEGGERLAEMTYSRAGDTMIIIDHTEVSESLKGQGVGQRLVEAGVEHARSHGLRVLVTCPFAKSVFERTPSLRDVLG